VPRASCTRCWNRSARIVLHTGTWSDPTQGVYVGWVAREGSFSEGMPLQNERGDVTLVFSGEESPSRVRSKHSAQSGMTLYRTGRRT